MYAVKTKNDGVSVLYCALSEQYLWFYETFTQFWKIYLLMPMCLEAMRCDVMWSILQYIKVLQKVWLYSDFLIGMLLFTIYSLCVSPQ